MYTLSELQNRFEYCPSTGNIYYKIDTNRSNIGDIAGCITKYGYLGVTFKYKNILLHRAAYMLYHNIFIDPTIQIDHINHNRSDNRILNLRLVNRIDNSKNRSKQCNNTSGVNGVYFDTQVKCWRAQVYQGKKCIKLGNYVEFSDAVAARSRFNDSNNFHVNHGL